MALSLQWPASVSGLLSVFNDERRRRRLKNSRVLIAARFHSAGAEDRVLPIRLARIIHVEVATGIYSLTFRLGRSVDFSSATDLSSCTFITSADVDYLAFEESIHPWNLREVGTAALSQTPEDGGRSWMAFCSLLSREAVLPINERAKQSLFFHVMAPVCDDDDEPAPVKRIRRTRSGDDCYGFRLKEGKRYSFTYSHYVPALEGKNTTVQTITVALNVSGASLELNTNQMNLIGNYGTQTFLVGATAPTSVWHALAIAPQDKTLKSQTGDIEIYSHRVEVPVAVRRSILRWIVRSRCSWLCLRLGRPVRWIDFCQKSWTGPLRRMLSSQTGLS
jgi:hypothetical protein